MRALLSGKKRREKERNIERECVSKREREREEKKAEAREVLN